MFNKKIFFIPFLLLIIIGGVIYFNSKKSTSDVEEVKYSNPLDSVKLNEQGEHILGNTDLAKIILIEYADPECPFCKSFYYKFMEQIYSKNPEKVAWVYRHFPLPVFSKSRREAEALECAAKQGGDKMFWQYLKEIYLITPSGNGLDPKELPQVAKKLNLDIATFDLCLRSGEFIEKISADKLSGEKFGVNQTPSVIIWNTNTNEKKLITAASSRFLEVKTIIEEALSTSN